MSFHGSVIQGMFIGARPRPAARVPGAAQPTRPVVQAHGLHGADVIPLEPGRLNLASSIGRPMPASVQTKMEALFGQDFSDVRIHSGPQAHSIGAIAFTQGSN